MALANDETYSPCPQPPKPEDYYGLLTNPPGRYGCMKDGMTFAITLRGSEEFAHRASNLFSSFVGDRISGRGPTTVHYSTQVNVREGYDTDTWLFCMPISRLRIALRTYFYTQLYKAKVVWREIRDEENVTNHPIDTFLL